MAIGSVAKGEIKRVGTDATVLAIGPCLLLALKVAEELEA